MITEQVANEMCKIVIAGEIRTTPERTGMIVQRIVQRCKPAEPNSPMGTLIRLEDPLTVCIRYDFTAGYFTTPDCESAIAKTFANIVFRLLNLDPELGDWIPQVGIFNLPFVLVNLVPAKSEDAEREPFRTA